MAQVPSIPEYYRNKTIFITGGTGFIGKVLIEKLLRSCPDLKNIYVLVREKKGRSIEDRIKDITDLPLFDLLKSQNPDNLEKIKPISGDVRELGLGLSPQDRSILINQVNVVFHGAASVRFDDSLSDAVILNTRGTREVVNLALEMKNLEVLLHISTTYCHTDHKVIEEKLYLPHADWEKTIEIAESVDKHTLDVLTEKYIHPLPNTYTFTKSLAENVVYDLCKGKIPALIYRPSIIISTAHEPIPGWIDNFNGPVGLLVSSAKGVTRVVYSNPDVNADYVPVDMTVKAIIIASWKQATSKNERLTLNFYNGSKGQLKPVTTKDVVGMGKVICAEVPMDNVLWYPSGRVTKCYYYYFIQLVFFHLLPAIAIDLLLRILGKKPMLLKIQRRIHVATTSLSYFTFNQWEFCNEKTVALQNALLPSDFDAFQYRDDEVEPLEYFKTAALGAKKYLLKEEGDLQKAKEHSRKMWFISAVWDVVWCVSLIWLIFIKMNVVSIIVSKCNKFIEDLITP